MSPRSRVLGALLAVLATGIVASLGAQSSLRSRVEGGGDARVQFRYAARADVCGLGSSIQVGTSTYINTGNSNMWNGVDRPATAGWPVGGVPGVGVAGIDPGGGADLVRGA